MPDRIQTIAVRLRDGTTLEGGWIDLFKLGSEVHYRGEVIKVDFAFAGRVLQHYRMFVELYGKEPPMLRQHLREGWQYGAWADMRLSSDGWVQGLGAFLDEKALQLFKAGQLREWSPGFGDVEHPHTGELLKDMMVEASFVDRGFQWNLRPPSVTNQPVSLAAGEIHTMTLIGDETMTTKTNAGAPAKTKLEGDEEGAPAPETTEEEVDMKAALGGIGKALAGIAEGQGKILAALQAIAPKEEEETTEMNADQKRVNQLEAEVRKLQRQNVLMELEGKGITGQVAEGLVELAHLAPEKYSSTVSELAARYEQPVAKVQSEIGTTGTAATGGGISAKKVLEAATAAGVKLGGGALPKWVQDNYPSQFDEVMAEAGLL